AHRAERASTGMITSLPRWAHRNLPRAAPPDCWQSLRSARVPPVHYLDKPLRLSLGATSHNPGVQFSMSKRVQFRMSVDRRALPTAARMARSRVETALLGIPSAIVGVSSPTMRRPRGPGTNSPAQVARGWRGTDGFHACANEETLGISSVGLPKV